ncbi:MAG: hypothetical protein IPK17_38685 [Chloroflexi bacterium]|uniref:hypothetical protein n=1 Tax=Candidatus Flexifilum breve TaxID=3140694 RepID=UPI003137091B|nr:hypothetical protein [Chloroflexota bacterium]
MVEPDLDENGLPLVDHINAVTNERLAEQVNLDEDEGIIGVGDTVQYLGQTYTVRASGSKVWLDVPSRHPLRSEGLDPDDIILIERAAHASTKAPQLPASVPAPSGNSAENSGNSGGRWTTDQ